MNHAAAEVARIQDIPGNVKRLTEARRGTQTSRARAAAATAVVSLSRHVLRHAIFAAMIAGIGGALPPRSSAVDDPQETIVDIGSRRELFVDESLVERLQDARLVLHRPRPREVALKFDQPWEGNTSGYVTVMRDGDLLRMIYRGHRMRWDGDKLRMSHSPVVCYAESRDGLRWKKPELRLFAWHGKDADKLADPLANNIVWPGSAESGTFVPFLDTRPGCPDSEKFKAVGGNYRTGLSLFTSPDAIHWKKSDAPIFKQGALDSMNVVFWDEVQGQYVLYFRTVVDGLRSISRATSPDLKDWSEPVPLEYPGSPPQQMYTNQIAPYRRAPHILFGFPTRYVARNMTEQLRSLEPRELRGELAAAYARVGSDLTDGLFMSSRDGVRFRRWDEAFLRPGPEADAAGSRWMYGDNYQNYGLFETHSEVGGRPNELSMLFSEGYWREGESRLRRYTMRLDGFVSIRAPYAGGEILTRPFTFSGKRLSINYSTSAAGSVRVELQSADGEPLPGFELEECPEIIGDRVEHTVRWEAGADVGALAGKPVRIRFVLRDADLYSFRFTME